LLIKQKALMLDRHFRSKATAWPQPFSTDMATQTLKVTLDNSKVEILAGAELQDQLTLYGQLATITVRGGASNAQPSHLIDERCPG